MERYWERLPDRTHGGVVPFVVNTPNGAVFMSRQGPCAADLVAGTYDCQSSFYFSSGAGVAWDPARHGIWHVDWRLEVSNVRFLRRVDGVWQIDDSLSGPIPEDIRAGLGSLPGICVVPGEGILVWSSSADLYGWDGSEWTTISAPGGPPAGGRSVASKWSWDDESGTCIGGGTTSDGLWIYKLAAGPAPVPGPAPDPDPGPTPVPDPDPAPDPVPDPEPDPVPPPPEPDPVEGLDIEAKWGIDRDNLPSIGGLQLAVAP